MEREGGREGRFRRIGGMRGRCGLAFWKRDREFCTHEDKADALPRESRAGKGKGMGGKSLREAESVGYW